MFFSYFILTSSHWGKSDKPAIGWVSFRILTQRRSNDWFASIDTNQRRRCRAFLEGTWCDKKAKKYTSVADLNGMDDWSFFLSSWTLSNKQDYSIQPVEIEFFFHFVWCYQKIPVAENWLGLGCFSCPSIAVGLFCNPNVKCPERQVFLPCKNIAPIERLMKISKWNYDHEKNRSVIVEKKILKF